MDLRDLTEGSPVLELIEASIPGAGDEFTTNTEPSLQPTSHDEETIISMPSDDTGTATQSSIYEKKSLPKQLTYEPLNVDPKEIRLLHILDEDNDHYVHCTLEITCLSSPNLAEYVALSYCWGDSSLTTPMYVNQSLVDVTLNLDAALRQLRLRGYHKVWVDALCVDQANKEERGSQVQVMQQIYSSAHLVISWVGSADDDTADAVKFLLERTTSSQGAENTSKEIDLDDSTPFPSPRFGQEKRNDGGQASPRYSRLEKAKRRWVRNQWSIIQDFFSQDYWKRVWVIQEVAVATDLRILYGKSEISWDHVSVAIVLWKETLMSLPTSHLSHLYAAQLLNLRDQFRNKTRMSLVDASKLIKSVFLVDSTERDSVAVKVYLRSSILILLKY